MSQFPADYEEKVLDDIKKYDGIRKPLKASVVERMLIKSIDPAKLHPNPDDEFSWPSVGPNFEIVSRYSDQIRHNIGLTIPLFDEPIIVEKMAPDGYMLINGHHRWFAALRASVPKVPIKIANLSHIEDIKEALNKSTNTKRVAFDLDEILLVAQNGYPMEPCRGHLAGKIINERLRLGVPELIDGLHQAGYDVWVYTAGYNSLDHIDAIFKMYGTSVDGIINGINRQAGQNKDQANEAKQIFENKYESQLHIDNDMIVITHPNTKAFEQIDLTATNDKWAEQVLSFL